MTSTIVATTVKIAVLPTLLTLGNGICGFAAIAFASKIFAVGGLPDDNEKYFAWAGWFILFGMVFDMLARKAEHGAQDRGAEFSDQFLSGVIRCAEKCRAKSSRRAFGAARPMR